jgi:hypothetical protein
MQRAFQPRADSLENNYSLRIRGIDRERDRARFVEVRRLCWEDYRHGYEKFIRAMEVSR